MPSDGASLYLAVYAAAIAVTAGASYISWQRRERVSARILTVLLASAAAWSLGIIGLLLTDSRPVFWTLLVFVTGVGGVTVTCWVLFAIEFTDSWPTSVRRTVALLSIEPVVTTVVTAMAAGTDLAYAVGQAGPAAGPTGFSIAFGPIYVLHVVYSYAVFGVGVALVLRFLGHSTAVFRRQAAAMAVAALPPFLAHVLYFVGIAPIDTTPVGFTVTGVVFLFGIYRMGFIDLTPVARDEVVKTIREGVLVLDNRNRIVDLNPRVETLFGADRADLVGRPLDDVMASMPGYREEIAAIIEDGGGEMTVSADGELRDLSVQMSPLYDRHDRLAGKVFVARDVTAQKRRQRELERKNEQLDRFAGVVSHDLRNPLNVASGRAELARETGDVSHLEEVTEALDRMESIIEDILTLAREGQTIDETEQVALSAVAENAWDHVDTAGASLRVQTDGTVEADTASLRRLFENLFRNAVEHGSPGDSGDGVVVTVGELEGGGGFYVADDGPGIPPDERDSVLEHGYTTADEGTGLGLAIVASIARAHGWEVAVTESESGGARFEVLNVATVTGVEAVSEDGLSLFRDDDRTETATEQSGDG